MLRHVLEDFLVRSFDEIPSKGDNVRVIISTAAVCVVALEFAPLGPVAVAGLLVGGHVGLCEIVAL